MLYLNELQVKRWIHAVVFYNLKAEKREPADLPCFLHDTLIAAFAPDIHQATSS